MTGWIHIDIECRDIVGVLGRCWVMLDVAECCSFHTPSHCVAHLGVLAILGHTDACCWLLLGVVECWWMLLGVVHFGKLRAVLNKGYIRIADTTGWYGMMHIHT